MSDHPNLINAQRILQLLGFPKAQQGRRTAVCLLALLNLTPAKTWEEAEMVMIGTTPIMTFAAQHYEVFYMPNSRETMRKESLHPFLEAGLVIRNPDRPERPPNSPKTVYQIDEYALALLRTYSSPDWDEMLVEYLSVRETLAQRYAQEQKMQLVPVQIRLGKKIDLSPGDHSLLIKAIIEDFAPRFTPGAELLYVGDTGDKWGYFDKELLEELGVVVDSHGKMPDVVLFHREKNWLLLIESVTSTGPVDGKRRIELARLFSNTRAGLVYVTAFPNKTLMTRFLPTIAWETEVWISDNPTHLVHFDGERFLGPYTQAIG